jgi:hypothetical protein
MAFSSIEERTDVEKALLPRETSVPFFSICAESKDVKTKRMLIAYPKGEDMR